MTTDSLGPHARGLLENGLQKLGAPCPDRAVDQLDTFLGLMARWNKRIGLTAVTEPDEIAIRHGLDSVTIEPFLTGTRVIDVGTGPGLPGMPLAILRPDLKFTLLDSLEKRMVFVRQAVWELGLENVEVVTGRVQTYRPEAKFDTLVTRAFSSLEETWARTNHLFTARFVAMKGKPPHDEIDALQKLFGDARDSQSASKTGKASIQVACHPVTVPGLDAQRSIVVVDQEDDHHPAG